MAAAALLTLVAFHATAAVVEFGPVFPFGTGAPTTPAPAFAAPPAPAPAVPPRPPLAEPAIHAFAPIRYIETAEPAVAITFDACATRTHTASFDRPVFDVVKRERVPITIFVSGRWVEAHPDVMAELAVDPQVEFGDHSYDHPHMSHLPVTRIIEEIDQTEAALARYGKRSVAFRPPFGEWSHRLVYVVNDLRLPTVTWDVVSGDPSAHTTTDRMIHNVLDNARPGSIIIFHINGRGLKTAEALPTILRGLRERGFRFVHVSELMAAPRTAPGQPVPIPAAPGPTTPPPVMPIISGPSKDPEPPAMVRGEQSSPAPHAIPAATLPPPLPPAGHAAP
ncbi:MAG TPA: polysaccharide deacetylase family protein [Polyangia bacterium]|jgi:peptidoglycan/xylan/chitin deacetylase (PgdA/CDA1 family)|nr:polysaccharide deacetylase family protein [Polyangia bacterium]